MNFIPGFTAENTLLAAALADSPAFAALTDAVADVVLTRLRRSPYLQDSAVPARRYLLPPLDVTAGPLCVYERPVIDHLGRVRPPIKLIGRFRGGVCQPL